VTRRSLLRPSAVTERPVVRQDRYRSVRRRPDPPLDEAQDDDPAVALPKALKAIGSVVAPASLLTALMYYFGVQHAYWYFRHFGVNYTVLGLSTQDFLVRSVDGLFLPLSVVAAGVLAALWAFNAGSGVLTGETLRTVQRRVAWVALVIGLLALKLSVVGIVRPRVFAGFAGLPGLCLAAAVLLLAATLHLLRRARATTAPQPPPWLGVAEWGAVFVVVSVGLFWAVTDYSAVVGSTRGERTAQQLADAPDVVLYSTERLSLPRMIADEVMCEQPEGTEGAFRYRYENLTLIFASEGQFVFLPLGWPADGGAAIVLPRSDSLRLEFIPAGLWQGATC
jgi:hypothetical protein